jgi:hypothetical protein
MNIQIGDLVSLAPRKKKIILGMVIEWSFFDMEDMMYKIIWFDDGSTTNCTYEVTLEHRKNYLKFRKNMM